MFLLKVRKISLFFHLKINIFTAVKYNCILYRRVIVIVFPTLMVHSLFFLNKTLNYLSIVCDCTSRFVSSMSRSEAPTGFLETRPNFVSRDIGKVEKTVIENEVPFGYVPGVPHLEAIAVYSMDSIATPSK